MSSNESSFTLCGVDFDELVSLHQCNRVLVMLQGKVNEAYLDIAMAHERGSSRYALAQLHGKLNNAKLAFDIVRERKEDLAYEAEHSRSKARLDRAAKQNSLVMDEVKEINVDVFQKAYATANAKFPHFFEA